MKIFLDLEETVIESWDNPLLINTGKISAFLRKAEVSEIGIFSFAIWNDKDRVDFERYGIQQAIEAALNVKITEILTVPEICEQVFWKQGTQMEVTEFITLWGKQRAFIDWALLTQTEDVMLIDDVVQNLTVIDHDRLFSIDIINVNAIQ